jgi:hypothetical protein
MGICGGPYQVDCAGVCGGWAVMIDGFCSNTFKRGLVRAASHFSFSFSFFSPFPFSHFLLLL